MTENRPSLDMSDPDQRALAFRHEAKDRWYDWELETLLDAPRIECDTCSQRWPCATKVSLNKWKAEEMNKLDMIVDVSQGMTE